MKSMRDIPCPPWDFLFDPCFGQEAGPKNQIIGTGFISGGRSGRGGTGYSFGASRRRSGGATPCIRSFRRKRIGREIGGIQAVQEEESDVAIGIESKAEQETVEYQDYPPLPEGTKLYVGNMPFDVDSEGLAKMFDESGVVEMVEVLSSYLFIITNLGFGMYVPLCVCQVF